MEPLNSDQNTSTVSKACLQNFKEDDYLSIRQAIGNAKVVMIGESTHGTQEFYALRARITRLLIEEMGFNFVAVEGDWPACYRANRFACLPSSGDETVTDALSDFKRFPQWMWRNEVVAEFLTWLQQHNMAIDKSERKQPKVGFYGLDLYSMHESARLVIRYLDKIDRKLAQRARERYQFLHNFPNEIDYGYAVAFGQFASQEQKVIQMCVDMLGKKAEYVKKLGYLENDEVFFTQMNAQVVKDAEKYYRHAIFDHSWNVRDTHMFDTLKSLLEHHASLATKKYGMTDPTIKAVVWAHNSHIGDARASRYAERGELNIGQLVRSKMKLEDTYSIGFLTNTGTVTAAERWGGERMRWVLNPALKDSYEELFHNVVEKYGVKSDFGFLFRANGGERPSEHAWDKAVDVLMHPRLERMIGVLYVKKTERQSHYAGCVLPKQFDFVIYMDRTSALKALADLSESDDEETLFEESLAHPEPTSPASTEHPLPHRQKSKTEKEIAAEKEGAAHFT